MSIGMAGILRSRDHEFTATKQRMVELAAENADLHREMKECRRIIGNTSVIVDVWDSTAVDAGLTAECATRGLIVYIYRLVAMTRWKQSCNKNTRRQFRS